MKSQWERIYALWNREGGLRTILGPLIGHGSDGDARRETLMMSDMLNPVRRPTALAGNAATPDQHYPRFNVSGLEDVINLTGYETEYAVYGIHSQDTIHNAKKLVNPLDQKSRVVHVGLTVAVWEHLGLVLKHCRADEHDLRSCDVERKDRQNFEVVQRACSPKTRRALRRVQDITGEDTSGTVAWLTMIHEYLLAFFGKKLTVSERVRLL